VVCDGSEADRYRRLLRDGETIDSRLADADGEGGDLAVHLNAEIALGTLRDVDDAMDWLETTYYYARAQRAADYATGDALRGRVSDALQRLADEGFVGIDGLDVEPTPLGELASEFYLRLDTAARFGSLSADPDEAEVLRVVAGAEEFDSVSARSDEQDAIDAVLGDRAAELAAGTRKVLAILQAAMEGSTPSALASDAWIIEQNALRLLGALRAALDRFDRGEDANLVRRIAARVETGISADAVGLTAIDGVGSTRATRLAEAGFETPADVLDAGVDGLTAAGLAPGVAERVLESARELPAVEVDWGGLPDRIARGDRSIHEVTVRTAAGDARASLRVTVNGVEMTEKDSYLGATTLPVALFGPEADRLELAVRVAFPDLPLRPSVHERSVDVTD
jgi:hypothetical protein